MLACLNACVVGLAPGYLDILMGLLPTVHAFSMVFFREVLGLASFWVWQGFLFLVWGMSWFWQVSGSGKVSCFLRGGIFLL